MKTQNWERSNYLNWETVPVLRQILTRRTVALHLRNVFGTFERTETQDEGRIRGFVVSLLHCDKHLSCVSGGTALFQGTGKRIFKGTDGVGSFHDEDQGGCSTRVKVVGFS